MIVIFETESGRLVLDEIFVRTGVGYEVRTEVVGEAGSALIGLDQNLQVKSTDGRWGGQITAGFTKRFGQAYDTELQHWVDAAKAGTVDGADAWDGYAAVAVCEAAVQALRTGRKARVQLGDGGRISVEAEEEPEPDIHAPDLIGDRP
jgi:myo-inositol 2-dehydrogenase/D-chiro-inositol 1-dehydrogenase